MATDPPVTFAFQKNNYRDLWIIYYAIKFTAFKLLLSVLPFIICLCIAHSIAISTSFYWTSFFIGFFFIFGIMIWFTLASSCACCSGLEKYIKESLIQRGIPTEIESNHSE